MNIHSSVVKTLQAAMFAGTVSLLMAAPAAHAVVVVNNTPIVIGNTIDGVYLNVVTGVSGTTAVTGWDINPYNNNSGLTFYGTGSPYGILATGTAGTTAVATLLTAGSVVGPASSGFYNQFQTVGTAGFQAAGDHYVGFRFLNETTSATNYGYLLVRSSAPSTAGFPATIISYAYENTGVAITIPSAVPEPTTYAMFGLGLAGLAGARAWKRRKAVAAA